MGDIEQHINTYKSSGDLEVLSLIYQQYTRKVFRVCMHYLKNVQDSEDAVVDIFLELREKLRKHDVRNFSSWLHTVTRNHCLKKLRGKGKLLLRDTFSEEDHVELQEDMDQLDELIAKLPDAMSRLDVRQQRCIEMFYLQGKSYKEIVSSTGYSPMEVKSGLQNGKIKLKKLLE